MNASVLEPDLQPAPEPELAFELLPLNEIDGGQMGWYAKGHHNRQDFAKVIEDQQNDLSGWLHPPHDAPLVVIPPASVRHSWWRCVPVQDEWGYSGSAFHPAKPHSRGAFAVTVCEHEPTAGWYRGTKQMRGTARRCRCSLCRVKGDHYYAELNKMNGRKRRLEQWRTARDWQDGYVLYFGDSMTDSFPCYYVEKKDIAAPHVLALAERYGFALPTS